MEVSIRSFKCNFLMKSRPNEITDILFDLGNVLVPFNWEIAFLRLRPFLPEKVVCLMTEDIQSFKTIFHQAAVDMEMGRVDFAQFAVTFSQSLGLRLSVDSLRDIWCNIFWMDENMVELGELLSKKYGTWLVSNTSKVHYQWIVDRFPRVAFFRGAALSYEMGIMKPSPLYYQRVIDMFGIDPGTSLFIDDLAENVYGARQAGFHVIRFKNRYQLLKDFLKVGIGVPRKTGRQC